ncbi:MAG: hypothetical protein VX633_04530, partial [Verrucomicrobiota bacterium]|nr:hypothetical protein [Verrucomicrobiota bacterium]
MTRPLARPRRNARRILVVLLLLLLGGGLLALLFRSARQNENASRGQNPAMIAVDSGELPL